MRFKSSGSTVCGASLITGTQLLLLLTSQSATFALDNQSSTPAPAQRLAATTDSAQPKPPELDEPFDTAKWKHLIEADPNLFAQFDRSRQFWRLLEVRNLIGMKKDQLVALFGDGQKGKDGDTETYLLKSKITGVNEAITGVQLEYKDGALSRWRLVRSNNKYPLKDIADAYRADTFSPWVTKNVIDSDICDAGLKIKKSLGFGTPVDYSSFENSRPPFDLVTEKKSEMTEEPTPLILLSAQPTWAELLNAAVLTQQALLVKVSREYADRALAAAKTDAEKKQSREFIACRLPLKTPSWPAELRHLESYSASARTDPEAAISGYSRNIRDEPAFEYSWYMLGMIKRENGNYAGAQEMFEKVLKINPKYQKALFGLASMYDHAGDTAMARKLAAEAYWLYPYDQPAKAIYSSVAHQEPPTTRPTK